MYKYITDNNLLTKQTYMYSEYNGMQFLHEYVKSRLNYLHSEKDVTNKGVHIKDNPVKRDLHKVFDALGAGDNNYAIIRSVNDYTKTFEVRKRLYTAYGDRWVPLDKAGFEDYENYLLFAKCLLLTYRMTGCLKYYNCLLKVDDTLLSVVDCFDRQLHEAFDQIIKEELNIFYYLADSNGIGWEKE